MRSPISTAASKRIRATVLIEDGGFSVAEACRRVGISRPSYTREGWLERFKEGDGSFDPLLEDALSTARAGNKHKMTPRTEKAAREAAKEGLGAQAVRTRLRSIHDERGDEDWDVTARTIQRNFVDEGAIFTRKPMRMMVRTPRHARWRMNFAQEWVDRDMEDVIFTDEKNSVCSTQTLADGSFRTPGGDFNVAKSRNMTDDEYVQWKEDYGRPLPHSKQRGLFPCFVWGGVGHNKKTELYFLEQGETLTAPTYRKIIKKELLPMRRHYPNGGAKPKMTITQDNDPKHYNDETNALLRRENIELLVSARLDINGDQDRAHHTRGPGANQLRGA